jgi:predicted kinase
MELLLSPAQYNWEALANRFDWLRNLKDCPQDPIYHAEGDVFIHTRMVVEELLNLPIWKSLSTDNQAILFAACLLHDVAKPICTVIEPDGKITSAGHAKKGEKLARRILAEFDLKFAQREQICKLVRHHGLPLWFLEKPNPEKAIVKASLSVNTELLAWVAEADVRGRVCADQAELLTKVALFRDYCQELNCWGKPKSFASDHTRFLYFHKEDEVYPDAEIFDDTQCEVFLLCGIPGAGKDTWIKQNMPHLPVISLDEMRREMGIDFNDNQGKVLQLSEERAREYLRKKQSFVWNATNLIRQRRKSLIDLFSVYKARTTIVFIDTPVELALRQNREREIVIKEDVIFNFFERMETPDLSEAHQLIIVER